MVKYPLKRKQIIRGQELFDFLYQNSHIIQNYPLRWRLVLRELPRDEVSLRMGFIVSKKNLKQAVLRNRIKRCMRELLRLEQRRIIELIPPSKQLLILIQFIGSEKTAQNFKINQQNKFILSVLDLLKKLS